MKKRLPKKIDAKKTADRLVLGVVRTGVRAGAPLLRKLRRI
jgi:hypothetical protein